MEDDTFYDCKPATLEEILEARELRAALQRNLIERNKSALICFTMNIPGEYKRFPMQEVAFDECKKLILRRLNDIGAELRETCEVRENAGCEAYFAVNARSAALKKLAVQIEEQHPLGRLYDIDVFGSDGVRLSGKDFGRPERSCLVCGAPVWQCARNRTHSAEALSAKTVALLQNYFDGTFADFISGLAQRALLYEVSATPKPGLVDRTNSGAHDDMDFYTFLDSVTVLAPFFRQCALKGLAGEEPTETLLESLRLCGVMAEEEMLGITGGVNTHKGAIFSLGILSAAAGRLYGEHIAFSAKSISAMCAKIARPVPKELKKRKKACTHGTNTYDRYGLTGIRGEAASGFQSVIRHGLPALISAEKSGLNQNDACVIAILALFAVVEDTNIAYRCGVDVLRDTQERVAKALDIMQGSGERLALAAALDEEFIRCGISPGGCADLLAVSLMVKFLLEGFP